MFRIGLTTMLLLCGFAAGAATPAPTGRWVTPAGKAVIQISPCGAGLCGQIVGIALAKPTDKMPLSWQGQSQCGMVILRTAAASGPAWVGRILDPRDGSVYRARLVLDQVRHLELHGYIGLPIFGQTQVWTPYNGPTPANCRLASATSGARSGTS